MLDGQRAVMTVEETAANSVVKTVGMTAVVMVAVKAASSDRNSAVKRADLWVEK